MSQILEMPACTIKKGVLEADFLRAHERFNREFMQKQAGYLSHKLIRQGDKFFDIAVWDCEKSKDKAFKDIYENEAALEYIALIDQDGTDDDIPLFSVVRDYDVSGAKKALLKQVTIRTNNGADGVEKMGQLWYDALNGSLAFQQGASLIAKYDNYESDENGDFDMSIVAASEDLFSELERGASNGLLKKYEAVDAQDVLICIKKAWQEVWSASKSGQVTRAWTQDYEVSIPAQYSQDGRAHCCLYIAIA